MLRVDAERIPAEMVDGLAWLQRSAVQFESNPMRPPLLPVVRGYAHIEEPVTVAVDGAGPRPAAVAASDLGLESCSVTDGAGAISHTTKYSRHTQFIGEQLLEHLNRKSSQGVNEK